MRRAVLDTCPDTGDCFVDVSVDCAHNITKSDPIVINASQHIHLRPAVNNAAARFTLVDMAPIPDSSPGLLGLFALRPEASLSIERGHLHSGTSRRRAVFVSGNGNATTASAFIPCWVLVT